MNYLEKRISINKAISILAKNGIHVNEQETAIILDFLYWLNTTVSTQVVRTSNP